MRILFIGDDREILQMVSRILRRSGYTVTQALGSGEAQERLRETVFDLVILDCDMKESQRSGLIQGAKKSPGAPALLLISGNREEEVQLLKAGADDWIQKPYQMEVLLARMAVLLRRKQTVNE